VGSVTSPSVDTPPERAPGGAAAGVERAPRADLLAGGEGDEAGDVGPSGVAAGGPFGGAPLRRGHAVTGAIEERSRHDLRADDVALAIATGADGERRARARSGPA